MPGKLSSAAMFLVAAIVGGCDNERVKLAWEEDLAPVLPSDYRDFTVEINGYDDGVKIFSLAPGPESDAGGILQDVREQIARQHPCYSLIDSSDHLLRMECTTPAERHRRIRRVEYVLASGSDRAFGMTISNDHTPELQQSYEQTLLSLAGREVAAP